MQSKLGGRFWAAMLVFGLMGQVAWVVENMYFNVFIYKMFHATAGEISAMVMASAVVAALTTIVMGAVSDRVGRRKAFMSVGYVIWGLTIVSFAWLRGDETNRGRIEGVNSMMPLISILVVFGSFLSFDLDRMASWRVIYYIIGAATVLIGVLGFFLIEEAPGLRPDCAPLAKTLSYSFRPSTVRQNPRLYLVLAAFALFGISIQIFMPYLLIYYEKTLGMEDYVLILAPAILLAAVVTAIYGRVYDRKGFRFSVWPALGMLCLGYVLLYFTRATVPVFLGSLLMMCGYLTGMSVFGARIRDLIPAGRAGQFQGVRIIGQVFIPGLIGPAIGTAVLRNAYQILNSDGTYSFLPSSSIFLAALAAASVLGLILCLYYMKRNSERSDSHA